MGVVPSRYSRHAVSAAPNVGILFRQNLPHARRIPRADPPAPPKLRQGRGSRPRAPDARAPYRPVYLRASLRMGVTCALTSRSIDSPYIGTECGKRYSAKQKQFIAARTCPKCESSKLGGFVVLFSITGAATRRPPEGGFPIAYPHSSGSGPHSNHSMGLPPALYEYPHNPKPI